MAAARQSDRHNFRFQKTWKKRGQLCMEREEKTARKTFLRNSKYCLSIPRSKRQEEKWAHKVLHKLYL